MKKLLLLALTASIVSCSNPIEEKINLQEYEDQIAVIKKEHPEYSEQDYATAYKGLNKYSFQAMNSGKMDTDITYKELLDKAKAENEEENEKIAAYHSEIEKISTILYVKAVDGKATERESISYPNGYDLMMKLENKSDKTVTAVKGTFVLKNENGEQIYSTLFEENVLLKAQETLDTIYSSLIFQDDNLTELKVLPFDKIDAKWYPETIIFENGERITAPVKPYSL